ncbi:MAG: lipase family protein, partial [Flavobacteriales bacterium]|nr:lipase family protein [Flavobacteriales bacterium]
RNIILIFLIIFNINGYSQFYSQEDINEAKDMAAICNSFTFLNLYNSDAAIIPKGYKKTFTSGMFGMDNKYQVYQSEKKAVISFRGSTAKTISWMENIYSSMVPAKGEIIMKDDTFSYQFATDTSAGVHAGYALGFAFLAKDVIHHIKSLNHDGIYEITITGHSQGGALAILLRAYLEHLPKGVISDKNRFKTYAFANPKVGNAAFVNDYIDKCEKGTNYSIVNVKDFVPKMPLSVNNDKKVSTTTSFSKLMFDKSYTFKDAAGGALLNMFGGSIRGLMSHASSSAFKKITKKVGGVKMPKYIDNNDYAVMGNRIELREFEYPKILKDPTILENDKLMAHYKRKENGDFEDESLYKSAPTLFQHKPYNYYAALLKKYDPKEYDRLKIKILPENL